MEYVLDTSIESDAIKIEKNKTYLGYDIYHWLTKKVHIKPEPIIKRNKRETSRTDRNMSLKKKVRKG